MKIRNLLVVAALFVLLRIYILHQTHYGMPTPSSTGKPSLKSEDWKKNWIINDFYQLHILQYISISMYVNVAVLRPKREWLELVINYTRVNFQITFCNCKWKDISKKCCCFYFIVWLVIIFPITNRQKNLLVCVFN